MENQGLRSMRLCRGWTKDAATAAPQAPRTSLVARQMGKNVQDLGDKNGVSRFVSTNQGKSSRGADHPGQAAANAILGSSYFRRSYKRWAGSSVPRQVVQKPVSSLLILRRWDLKVPCPVQSCMTTKSISDKWPGTAGTVGKKPKVVLPFVEASHLACHTSITLRSR